MDKYELEKLKRIMEDQYHNDWPDKYRPSKWRDNDWTYKEYNYPDIPDWVDEVVKQKKVPSKPKATRKAKPQPPKRKTVKKSSSVGGALAKTLNEIDA